MKEILAKTISILLLSILISSSIFAMKFTESQKQEIMEGLYNLEIEDSELYWNIKTSYLGEDDDFIYFHRGTLSLYNKKTKEVISSDYSMQGVSYLEIGGNFYGILARSLSERNYGKHDIVIVNKDFKKTSAFSLDYNHTRIEKVSDEIYIYSGTKENEKVTDIKVIFFDKGLNRFITKVIVQNAVDFRVIGNNIYYIEGNKSDILIDSANPTYFYGKLKKATIDLQRSRVIRIENVVNEDVFNIQVDLGNLYYQKVSNLKLYSIEDNEIPLLSSEKAIFVVNGKVFTTVTENDKSIVKFKDLQSNKEVKSINSMEPLIGAVDFFDERYLIGYGLDGSRGRNSLSTADEIIERMIFDEEVSETYNENDIKILINNKHLKTDSFLGIPFIEDGRTLVPLRVIVEALGLDVDWEGDTQKIIINNEVGSLIYFQINSNILEFTTFSKSGEANISKRIMDATPILKDGRTYIPLRFLSEILGYEIRYDYKGYHHIEIF
ncbi:copper amine oxidase-like protein [Natranaerovirga pectinivora]|uniref:Copper amine oxidase-like protein n=1 Tax=Natranaerovirga pectinivora TaxID=682400 RepID=A0A4R3MNF7_9FIRM|nr:copper amine oxidase N-terminal domain-containing protein [Natranaerovirga pectinivora]TCT15574.1 copper amine oxidase-like protein [Natranaerovirga pectinivora]